MWCWSDNECLAVTKALNKLPRIKCYEWCWGHNKDSFMVRFTAGSVDNIEPVLEVLRDIAPCDKEPDWTLEIEQNFTNGQFVFRLRGPIMALEAIEAQIDMLVRRLNWNKPRP